MCRPSASTASGYAGLVEGPADSRLGPVSEFGQLPQGTASLVLAGHELDELATLLRRWAVARGAAVLRQRVKHRAAGVGMAGRISA